MVHKIKNFSPYKKRLCRKTLQYVFDTLWFDDVVFETTLRDSYFLNLEIMRQYARDKNLDEISYILGIREELLKNHGVHDYGY